jgi:hypothetical protein
VACQSDDRVAAAQVVTFAGQPLHRNRRIQKQEGPDRDLEPAKSASRTSHHQGLRHPVGGQHRGRGQVSAHSQIVGELAAHEILELQWIELW